MASLKEETTEEVMGVVMDLRQRRRSFMYVQREEHHEAMETTLYVPVNNLVWWAFFYFGKLKIGNYWREPFFNLSYVFSNLIKHNIYQAIFGKLLEMLLWRCLVASHSLPQLTLGKCGKP